MLTKNIIKNNHHNKTDKIPMPVDRPAIKLGEIPTKIKFIFSSHILKRNWFAKFMFYYRIFALPFTNVNKTIENIASINPYKNVASGFILSQRRPAMNPPGRATSPIAV